MRKGLLKKYISLLLISVFVLSGCNSVRNKAEQGATPAASLQKPPLEIPKSFSDEGAKIAFATGALQNGYFAEVQKLMEESIAQRPNSAYYQLLGAADYNQENFTGAVEAWNKAAELTPSLAAEMQNNIGNVLRDQKQIDSAKEAYRKALSIDPKLTTAAVNLAFVLRNEGKLNDAIKVVQDAMAQNKSDNSLADLLSTWQKDLAQKPGN